MPERPALTRGRPRLGTVFFDAREPGRLAMAFDTGEEIELTVNFDHGDPIGRRFSGRSMSYGDDPDYRIHDYSMPTQAWFYDPHGSSA